MITKYIPYLIMFSLVVLGFYLLSVCASALNSIAEMEHQVNTKLTKIEKVFDKIDAFIDSANSEKYCDWSCKKN